jgi:hypothetical protein
MYVCPKCKNTKIQKNGTKLAYSFKLQKLICTSCGHQWSEKIEVALIEGITAKDRVDFEGDIMPYLKSIGKRALDKNIEEQKQVITMPNKPFALALLSDMHGGGKSDYEAIERDIEIITSTDGMYVGNLGDDTDNFINNKLMWVQMHQPTTHDMETRFLEWLFAKLSGHVLFWVSGNHNNWTSKVSGIDYIREGLKGTKCLYNSSQIFFTLKWGDNQQNWLVRHKWKYSSIFNTTHGIEVGWERVGFNFDVGCGGHTHIATLCRPFIREDKKRYAILLGTYKIRDSFSREIGYAKSFGTGSGAFVYHPDGRQLWCEDLSIARDLLQMWQKEF